MDIDYQFGLGGGFLSPWMPNGANRTYVENLKDPDEVLLPTGNLVLVAFREDESEDRIPFTLLDDLALDPSHSPAIGESVSGLAQGACITGVTHVVRTAIASRTDWLSSSVRLPFNLR